MARKRQVQNADETTVATAENGLAGEENAGTTEEKKERKPRTGFYIVVDTDETGRIGDALWQGATKLRAERFIEECAQLLKRSSKAVAILRVKPVTVKIL